MNYWTPNCECMRLVTASILTTVLAVIKSLSMALQNMSSAKAKVTARRGANQMIDNVVKKAVVDILIVTSYVRYHRSNALVNIEKKREVVPDFRKGGRVARSGRLPFDRASASS